MSSLRVGFIGMGNIGLPMAKSLAKKGLPLTIYARRKEVVSEMKSLGATAARSCREMAAASDVVISVVRDIPQTEEVMFGKDGVWEGIKEGATIVISSTIGSEYCQQLYARAKERGVQVIDAALSKNHPYNEEGGFTLMIGGDEDAVKRCWPVFEAMATHPFHVGRIGMGQTFKLVNAVATHINRVVIVECLNLGLKAGLDMQKMIDVIRVSTGNSNVLEHVASDYMNMSRNLPPGPAVKASRGDQRPRELAIKLGEKVGANTPLLEFIGGLDMESAYDAYTALSRKFKFKLYPYYY